MAKPIIVATAFLVVGLVIGTAAAFVFVAPPTRTQTQSVAITRTKTLLLTQTTTLTQQATTTSTQSTTQFATSTSTSSITNTVTVSTTTQFTNQTLTVSPTVTQTKTSTTTVTRTSTVTTTSISSIATGRTLVRNNGSGNANSPSFNASVANVQVNFNATATGGVSGVALAWYIYGVGNSTSTCSGSINAQQGRFVDYCYRLVQGSEYYIRISSTNANWSVDVVELD